jgi:predicted amidohydrolase YtcJ
MTELGAIGVVQPGFVDVVGTRTGDARFDDATWMPFRSAVERGVTVAGSSDDPCGPRAPLVVSEFGITRRTSGSDVIEEDQALSRQYWLRAYTVGAATAGGQLQERGTLAIGKRADLVAVDGLEDSKPSVWATWVAGERVFNRDPGS